MPMTKTDAIRKFLLAKTHDDLAKLYNPNMEVQVNVAKDDGELVVRTNKFNKQIREWTNGFQTWKNFRIPFNANTTPEYTDTELRFSLEEHCEGVGMTGWDWINKQSLWVAYDFDAITGHSDKHSKKLTDSQLQEVREAVEKIPFATLRLSTSGKGLHLYVALRPISTTNHTEHAAVGRSILSLMSGMIGFDFTNKVDVAGSNMWVWHRKMIGTDGLKLLRTGSILEQVPPNWREHLDVVTRKRTRSLPQFIAEAAGETNTFEELTSQRTKVTLDDEHKKLINWLTLNNCVWWWDNDNWMIVTHTKHLKDAHIALNLRGKFDTATRHSSSHNCFGYPLRNGAWSIRRYNRGVSETDTWNQDGKGWTTCTYNRNTDLTISARLHKGIEHEKGGYVFYDATSGLEALKDIGIELVLPLWILNRQTTIKRIKNDNKLLVTIVADERHDIPKDMDGWLLEKKFWKRIFKFTFPNDSETEVSETYDDLVRHIYTEDGEDAGWVMIREKGWCAEPLVHIKTLLRSMENDNKDLDTILGKAISNAWKLVCKPFLAEYPGNREWNRRAAQFAVPPSANIDNLTFPTWQKVLTHCGEGLDEAIKVHPWCLLNGILNGADYLTMWIASVIKYPERPAPYLGFYGEQDCGKSIFHEMLNFLIVNGIQRGDIALTNGSAFNGELENAIVVVVEETDLRKDKRAYNRLKDWVTSPMLMIHIKNVTPYQIKNYAHFVQTANELEYFPVFPGDTRMTLIYVNQLKADEKIAKITLENSLKKEASDFLAYLLNIEIPEFNDRLTIPIIETEGKRRAVEKNMNPLESFISEYCHNIPGHAILSLEFYNKFLQYLDDDERPFWSRHKVGRALPDKFPRGKIGTEMQQHYGNMTFDPEATPRAPYRLNGQFLTNKD